MLVSSVPLSLTIIARLSATLADQDGQLARCVGRGRRYISDKQIRELGPAEQVNVHCSYNVAFTRSAFSGKRRAGLPVASKKAAAMAGAASALALSEPWP